MTDWKWDWHLSLGLIPLRSVVQWTSTFGIGATQLDQVEGGRAGGSGGATGSGVEEALAEFGLVLKIPEITLRAPALPWGSLVVGDTPSLERLAQVAFLNLVALLPREAGGVRDFLKDDEYSRSLTDLRLRTREALALACLARRLVFAPSLRDLARSWNVDVRRVLVDREPVIRARRPTQPLFRLGYTMLQLVTDMRSHAHSFEDYRSALTRTTAFPLAFEHAVWWDAVYRLSEIGQETDAAKALDRLKDITDQLNSLVPGLQDEVVGSIWLHQGRLAYYRGDFAESLEQLGKEWRLQVKQAGHPSARIRRLFANVLCDTGHFAAARELAWGASRYQVQNDEPEDYKSLGRLAEIFLRSGDTTSARRYYRMSWKKQQEHAGAVGKPLTGQTPTYLGHTALLRGELDEAERCYLWAGRLDRKCGDGFNPYTLMGRVAVANRRGDADGVARLVDPHLEGLKELKGAQVLPAAVIDIGRFRAGLLDAAELEGTTRRLIGEMYFVEALGPLSLVASRPSKAMDNITRILDGLGGWGKALARIPEETARLATLQPEDLAPDMVRQFITRALEDDSWNAVRGLLPRIVPINLIEWS